MIVVGHVGRFEWTALWTSCMGSIDITVDDWMDCFAYDICDENSCLNTSILAQAFKKTSLLGGKETNVCDSIEEMHFICFHDILWEM